MLHKKDQRESDTSRPSALVESQNYRQEQHRVDYVLYFHIDGQSMSMQTGLFVKIRVGKMLEGSI